MEAPIMKTRSRVAAAAMISLLACGARAANDYSSLLRNKKFAEVERIANARLAQNPLDADALVAKAEAIAAAGPADRADEAVRLAQRCTDAHPQASTCYLALGNALGAKAKTAHAVAAMRSAQKVRDAFARAVELDPRNSDARFALLDYYMHAPAIVGGGIGKARTLAAQTVAVNPAAAALMRAQLQLAANDFARAEATMLAVQPADDEMVADRQRDLLTELARRYHDDKRYADSDRIVLIVRKRFPQ